MATSSDFTEELMTTCPICLEQMNTPKFLPCLHTFCALCIEDYAKGKMLSRLPALCSTNVNNDTTQSHTCNSMQCPVCRSSVEITVAAQQWAKNLPINFLIVELIKRSKIEKASIRKLCGPCERIGEENDAIKFCVECGEMFCKVCSKFHLAQKISMTHTIKEIQSISNRDFRSSHHHCKLHAGEIVKLYCCDHEIECCSICVSVDHRKCESVKTLECVANDFRKSPLTDKCKDELMKAKDTFMSVREKYIFYGKLFEEMIKDCREEVEEFRKELKVKIDLVADEMVAKLIQCSLNCKDKTELNVSEVDDKLNLVCGDLTLLQTIVDKASNAQVMAQFKEIQKQVSIHTSNANTLEANILHPHLSANMIESKNEISSKLDHCFVSSNFVHCESENSCDKLSAISLNCTSEIMFNTLEHEACFTGTGKIAVSDFIGKALNLYSVEGRVLSKVKLGYSPHDITSDMNGYVAVINSEEGFVEMFEEESLKSVQKFDIEKDCRGIFMDNENFIVSYSDTVKCYERSKGVLVNTLISGIGISWYIHKSKLGVFYSTDHVVHCINERNEEYLYSSQCGVSLEGTSINGITTDSKNNLYIACMDKIVQISVNGSKGKTLLEYGEPKNCNIFHGRGIAFNKDFSYFLVVNGKGKSCLVYKIEFKNTPENKNDDEKDDSSEQNTDDK